MTKTAVGAEEPDDNENESLQSGAIGFPAHVTISGDGKMMISYLSNSTGSVGPAIISSMVTSNSITANSITQTSPTQPLLFGQWIEKTKYLQEEFYGQKFEDFTHEQLVEWVRINILAAEDELHEALGEISWKPWASSQFFNRDAYLGEIVDVLHFVGNLLAGAGVSDVELNAAYLEKMERNRARQRAGYTGIDKCRRCKRAVDDIIAHGGDMVQGDESGQLCNFCAGSESSGSGEK